MTKWANLPPGSLAVGAVQPGIDAQLLWADGTRFIHLRRQATASTAPIAVLVELTSSANSAKFSKDVKAAGGDVHFSVEPKQQEKYFGAVMPAKFLKRLLKKPSDYGLSRVELQMPVIPQRARPSVEKIATSVGKPRLKCQSEVLLGVIDSACPFAHPHFRQINSTSSKPSTRILHLWIQDGTAQSSLAAHGSRIPADFSYGHEITRTKLNALMRRCIVSGQSVDEAVCYERAGLQALRHRFTHGAAVLDLFASPQPLASRMGDKPDDLPTWANDKGAASTGDIVFVQLPQDAVQDSSSASVAKHILDGLQYIISCAEKDTKKIVVNISEGSSRGSHDGNSVFEKALLALLEQEKRLHVVIGAGNNFTESRHAQISIQPGQSASTRFRLPPGCESPAFLFVRIPAGATGVHLQVRAPGGASAGVSPQVGRGEAKALHLQSHPRQPACTVIYPQPLNDKHAAIAMVVWAPTHSFDPGIARALSGDWEIKVEVKKTKPQPKIDEPIHIYVARNQVNAGALPRSLQGWLIDSTGLDEPRRHLEKMEDDPHSSLPQSPIRRKGSLSSLATVLYPRIVLVGAFFYREGIPSLYSSEGPAAGSSPRRTGPDAWAPADTNRALRGVRAYGGIAGTVVRVSGTSFSTPQVARDIANGKQPPYSQPTKNTRRRSRIGGI